MRDLIKKNRIKIKKIIDKEKLKQWEPKLDKKK